MVRSSAKYVFAVLTATVVLMGCEPKEQSSSVSPEVADGQLLVKFKDTVSTLDAGTTLQTAGLEKLQHLQAIDVYLCRVAEGGDVDAAVRTCQQEPSIEYAEPNYMYHALEVPNDPRFDELWAMSNTTDADIDAVEAWDTQTGFADILFAVIDTGVDYTHEDLTTNMWRNPGESGEGRETNGRDDDGNGRVDDVFGWDFAGNDNDPMDDNGHGTHVAGTIAAAGDNAIGVAGVNWRGSIMALKFLSRNGSGSASDAISAILYASEMGARIQNNSWGGGPFSQALRDAIRFARDRNSIFVAAAGNEGNDNDANPSYPASYEVENVISVAASDRNDRMASFSNFGLDTVDLAAPGVDILSCQPGNGYRSFSGTSMATPHVCGVTGLVLAENPSLAYRTAMIRVVGSVDPVEVFESKTASGGRLNAARALAPIPAVAFVTRLRNTTDTVGPYQVRAEVAHGGVVQSAMLQFAVDGAEMQSVPMQSGAGHTYEGEIPGQALGAGIEYFVLATGENGFSSRSRSFEFSIAQDAPAPPVNCGQPAVASTGPPTARLAGLGLNLGGLLALFWFSRRVVRRTVRDKRV